MTEPNEFDEFRRHREIQDRRRRIAVRVLDALTALALAVMAVLVLKMIFY